MKIDQEQFNDAELRVEQVLSLSWVADFHALSEATEEMFGEFDDVAKTLGIKLSQEAEEYLEDEEWEGLAHWLFRSGMNGVFVQVAQPILKKDGEWPSFSWGYYTTHWFYADSINDALAAALEWAQQNWDKVRGAA